MSSAASAVPLAGSAIVEAIAAAGVHFVVSVPDLVTSEAVLRPIASDARFRLVRVCKEDEGVSICAALSVCGKRALLLMQYTGLLDSLNAIRAIACEYRQPVCMMVGMLGHESDQPAERSARYGVRIVPPILDAMGIRHAFVAATADVAIVGPAIEQAYRESAPLVLMIGRSPT